MSHWKNMPERVEDYLSVRRRLGYKLQIEGQELHRFARFAQECGHTEALTIELAVAWANSSKKPSDLYRARRLEILRGLSKYCALFEPETEISPPGLLGPAHRRVSPYIYTEQEISDLLETAGKLKPTDGLRPATLRCLIGLLAATGLRISEALHLNRTDVDFKNHMLVVRETKFRKSRYVPLHPTSVKALNIYIRFRDRLIPLISTSTAFFMFDDGRPLHYRQALYAFQTIRRRLGWEIPGKRPPRLQDLRHTFACHRLLSWYKKGVDVNKAILSLSVYLGHSKVTDTYWYLTGVPTLMAIAAERFEILFSKEQEVEHG